MAEKIYEINTDLELGDSYLWQYEQAEKFKQLMYNQDSFYHINVKEFFDSFLTDIFNINTATTFGLNLWGMTLGIPRPIWTDSQGVERVYSDEQYRTLIKGRLLLMQSNCSIHDFNAYLNYLFPGKNVFTIDYNDMSISLIFFYSPTEEERAVILQEGFLPRPAGVEIKYIIVPPAETFGFYGSEFSGFDQGIFFS